MTIVDNPTKFADKFKTSSSRLQNFNYSTPGFYFITICTLNKNNFFGKIINNHMELSKMGLIANQCLIDIPNHFKNVLLNEYVVMPNHVHILLNLEKTKFNHVETHHDASLTKRYNNYFYHRIAIRSSQAIPLIIKQFKSAVTKEINPKIIFFAWQPRYHDHIVKDKQELIKIKNYIINNPINWQKDKFYKK
jgi:putative transposase